MEKNKSILTVKEMVEMGLLISLAIILDLDGLKISLGSNGGSIGFTMLPLIVLSYRQGFYKSLIGIGFVYGLVTNLLDGWGLIYFPFDYFVAYGVSISLVGLFKDKIFKDEKLLNNYCWLIISLVLIFVVRIMGHTLSSMIFYHYTFIASLSYNIAYVLPSIIVCLVVLIILLPTLKKINKKFSKKVS